MSATDDSTEAAPVQEIVHWFPPARRLRLSTPDVRALAVLGLGAAAFGALAIGALSIGALAAGRLAVGKARMREVRIDRLIVGKLDLLDR